MIRSEQSSVLSQTKKEVIYCVLTKERMALTSERAPTNTILNPQYSAASSRILFTAYVRTGTMTKTSIVEGREVRTGLEGKV